MRMKRLQTSLQISCFSTAIFCAVPFSASAQTSPGMKLDSISKAKFDSIPEVPNQLFSEVPEWKPTIDSVFASYFENRGKNFQWKKFRYPLKLNRKYFEVKLKKNEEASRKKQERSPNEKADSSVDEDRTIEVDLFKGEKVVLICDTIMYDGLVGRNIWKGHVRGSKGSDVRITVDRPNIFISIRMLERAPFKISSPFNNGVYILEQVGPSLYPVDYLGSPRDPSGG